MLKKKRIRRKRFQKIVKLKLRKRGRNVYLLRKKKSKVGGMEKKRYIKIRQLSPKIRLSYKLNKKLYSPKSFKNLWLFIRKGFKPVTKKRKKRSLVIKKQRNIKPPYG